MPERLGPGANLGRSIRLGVLTDVGGTGRWASRNSTSRTCRRNKASVKCRSRSRISTWLLSCSCNACRASLSSASHIRDARRARPFGSTPVAARRSRPAASERSPTTTTANGSGSSCSCLPSLRGDGPLRSVPPGRSSDAGFCPDIRRVRLGRGRPSRSGSTRMISKAFRTWGCMPIIARSAFFSIREVRAFRMVAMPALVMKLTPVRSRTMAPIGSDRARPTSRSNSVHVCPSRGPRSVSVTAPGSVRVASIVSFIGILSNLWRPPSAV